MIGAFLGIRVAIVVVQGRITGQGLTITHIPTSRCGTKGRLVCFALQKSMYVIGWTRAAETGGTIQGLPRRLRSVIGSPILTIAG